MTQAIGWASSALLIVALLSQVWKEWKSCSVEGVSVWLFYGQVLASAGFTVYSVLSRNPVFVVANALGLASALAGTAIYYRNRRVAAARRDRATPG